MQWSYPYADDDVHGAILGAQGSRSQVFAVLADAGYEGAEVWVRDPRQLNWTALGHDLTTHGLRLAAIGTGPMGTDDGLSLTDDDDEVRAEFIARFEAALAVAAMVGAPVMLGKQRGMLHHHVAAAAWQRDGLRRIYDTAEELGADVALEPQNAGVVDNVNTLDEALALQAPYGAHARVMLDTFHMHLDEPNPMDVIPTAGAALVHMHIADNERRVPGLGRLPLEAHVQQLEAVGYDRFVSFELDQGGDWAATARAAVTTLR
jgi:sugar phosphate isomerase/epimerase